MLEERHRDELLDVITASHVGVVKKVEKPRELRVAHLKRSFRPSLVLRHQGMRQDLPIVVAEVLIEQLP
jgi:hypothetical protein